MQVLSLWGRVSAKFSAPPSGKTMHRIHKSFRSARTFLRFSINLPSLVVLEFYPPPGRPKTLLSFLFVCLSVRHALKRRGFCVQFRHEGVGVQKRRWCRWIGEGL